MRLSEFWQLMDDEFDPAYSRVLAKNVVLGAVDGLTAEEALKKGIEPKRIWLALCDIQDVPPQRRLGKDTPPRS